MNRRLNGTVLTKNTTNGTTKLIFTQVSFLTLFIHIFCPYTLMLMTLSYFCHFVLSVLTIRLLPFLWWNAALLTSTTGYFTITWILAYWYQSTISWSFYIINFGSYVISSVTVARDLGVWFHATLSMSAHIQKTCASASGNSCPCLQQES